MSAHNRNSKAVFWQGFFENAGGVEGHLYSRLVCPHFWHLKNRVAGSSAARVCISQCSARRCLHFGHSASTMGLMVDSFSITSIFLSMCFDFSVMVAVSVVSLWPQLQVNTAFPPIPFGSMIERHLGQNFIGGVPLVGVVRTAGMKWNAVLDCALSNPQKCLHFLGAKKRDFCAFFAKIWDRIS